MPPNLQSPERKKAPVLSEPDAFVYFLNCKLGGTPLYRFERCLKKRVKIIYTDDKCQERNVKKLSGDKFRPENQFRKIQRIKAEKSISDYP